MNPPGLATAIALFLTTFSLIPHSAEAYETITCDSRNGRRNSCYVGGGRIRAVRQLSNASCNGNWNYDGERIIVRNGCRAQFVIDSGWNRNYRRYDRNNYYYQRDNYYLDRYNRQRRYYRQDYPYRNPRCRDYYSPYNRYDWSG